MDQVEAFSGKTVLVTGAGQGIGRSIASMFARRGADLCLLVRSNVEAAEEVAREIKALGRRAFVYRADIADEAAIFGAVRSAIFDLGKIDVLVNNASMPGTRGLPLHELPSELWRKVIETNIHGTYFACKAVIPHMIERGGGAIVNISSIAAVRPLAFWGSYSVSKIGVEMLTRQLALELAEHKIRVNCIAPGLVATPRTQPSLNDPELVALRAPGLPFNRAGTADEIAETVCFMASDAASYITGQVLIADGAETDAWPIRTALAKRAPIVK